MNNSGETGDRLDRLAEEFAARWRAGERPLVTEYAEKYPELASEIRELFPALLVMENLKPVTGDLTGSTHQAITRLDERTPLVLGEYRLLREIGRGGMGMVYEAVQESLGRHVALKILPGHGLGSATYLERFRREARAAGRLHHTNIVPVFGTGECGGVHYYAMQFIPGQGLDRVLDDLRRLRGSDLPVHGTPCAAARGLLTGELFAARTLPVPETVNPGDLSSGPIPFEAPSTVIPSAPRCTDLSIATAGTYFRSVARVGLQVAEALAHAHRQGILHRDIKPSNLLLDPQGTVWVTDFGLAKADEESLTGTGDILGTLRYMAPERFEGVSLPEGDVYSLGLTLYEMLTLRPVFEDANRARLIERVIRDAPVPLRRVDSRVPRDLETVVMKCLAKAPAERYATASDLASDLRLFLADQPVRARRTPRHERAWRWCKRNPWVATLSLLVALLLCTLASGSVVVAFQFRKQRDEAIETADRARKAEQKATRYLELSEIYRRVLPDPIRLNGFRGKNGQSYFFRVTGRLVPPPPHSLDGDLWGTDVYTDDSILSMATVHAGVLRPGQRGIVKVTILPGRSFYPGSRHHGVASKEWNSPHEGSYRIEAVPGLSPEIDLPALAGSAMDPSSHLSYYLMGFRRHQGESFHLDVTGLEPGPFPPLWGTDVYSDDSLLEVAVVHAGILRPGQRGVVKVTILPGRDSYQGSTRNGITSADYGPWGGSFKVEPVKP
jgi:serine/threonine protein kinase